MNFFDFIQLLVDIGFLFFLLLLFLGRSWKRGPSGGAAAEEQESYREMISTLTLLIKEMKQSVGEMQEQLGAKQVELRHAIAAADEKLAKLGGGRLSPAAEWLAPVRLPREEPASAHENVRETAARPASAHESMGEAAMRPVPEYVRVAAPPPAHEDINEAGLRPGEEPERTLADDDKDRAEKYRKVLEFADKGWGSLDIARFLKIPRGEVDLLMRTKVRKGEGDAGI